MIEYPAPYCKVSDDFSQVCNIGKVLHIEDLHFVKANFFKRAELLLVFSRLNIGLHINRKLLCFIVPHFLKFFFFRLQ